MKSKSERKEGLWRRLRRGRESRGRFVDSHIAKAIAFQIRAMRMRAGWSQQELAEACGMTQNQISRLESSDYGRPSITTLKRIAKAFDVALIVRFAPFSELVDWTADLAAETLDVKNFSSDEIDSTPGDKTPEVPMRPVPRAVMPPRKSARPDTVRSR